MEESHCVRIGDESGVGAARREAARLSRAVGLDEQAAGRLAIVVTELAKNLWQHAHGGELVLRALDGGVELLALDNGPGMADVGRAMGDGYSTSGTAGTGLGAVRRQSQVCDIYSSRRRRHGRARAHPASGRDAARADDRRRVRRQTGRGGPRRQLDRNALGSTDGDPRRGRTRARTGRGRRGAHRDATRRGERVTHPDGHPPYRARGDAHDPRRGLHRRDPRRGRGRAGCSPASETSSRRSYTATARPSVCHRTTAPSAATCARCTSSAHRFSAATG